MKLLLFFVILSLLIIISYQDFKQRAVSAFLFPVITVAGIIYSYQYVSLAETLLQTAFSIGFIVVQWLLLSVYISIKNKKLSAVTTGALGWGDVLFWLFLAVVMPFINFILFFIISLMLVVIAVLVLRIFSRDSFSKIPLAGIQALLFVPVLTIDVSEQISLWNY